MTPYELGKISAFLLKNRKIEERSQRRAIQREERDLAEILRDAAVEEIQLLEEMMTGYGFDFVTLSAFDVKGIAPGSRVHLLVRRNNSPCLLLDSTSVIEKMAPSAGKASVAKIWFTQIWLMHLDLMYSAKDRGPHERNQWLDSGFTKEQLIEAVRVHINEFVRKLNPEIGETSEVYSTLRAEKGVEIPRYVTRFLGLMVDAGMLDEIAPNSFRQSLLSAVEVKANYDRILAPLMLDISEEHMPGNLAQTAHVLLSAVNETSTERNDS